ncbi:MAG: hypothetical protein C4541_02815 [Candidatus Auribacter fodinae]|uniref:AsmA-like C-terminal domain-containing protein n=1 Tax=Candidatus Auribacter fodinae TaxID=2093366 RepID=A0A3A4R7Q1_9BACT|nr:MAG: hypothetical protein C4541_02815 [Candidatus Auribacter fodinae]
MKKLFLFFCFCLITGMLLIIAATIYLIKQKDTIARQLLIDRLNELIPDSEITIGTTHFEVPDEIYIRHLKINAPRSIGIIDASGISTEFNPYSIRRAYILDRADLLLERFECTIKEYLFKEFTVRDIQMNGKRTPGDTLIVNGTLSVRSSSYKKFVLQNVECEYTVHDKTISVVCSHIEFAGGTGKGSVTAQQDNDGLVITGSFSFSNLNALDVFTILNLNTKMSMTGLWNATLDVRYVHDRFETLGGTLYAVPPGGDMHIKDAQMIANMIPPNQRNNPHIVDSIVNYTYSDGKITISLEEKSILFNLNLNGNTGKRNIDIYLHDLM